jgi:hypothetical protein
VLVKIEANNEARHSMKDFANQYPLPFAHKLVMQKA